VSSTSTIRVRRHGVLRGVVADVQPLWRDALAAILARLGFGSVDECASCDDLQALLRQSRPHLVVFDPEGLDGAEDDVAAARTVLPHLRVVVVSAERAVTGAFDAFVSKQCERLEIQEALHDVIREHLDWAATLSPRELEILRLVADGAGNRAVAAHLWLSDQTVKFHLANAYRKLGVSSRYEAVNRLRAAGFLPDLSVTSSTMDPLPAAHTGASGRLDT
jgi:DNA-binding NarL/FixJ family response regulator